MIVNLLVASMIGLSTAIASFLIMSLGRRSRRVGGAIAVSVGVVAMTGTPAFAATNVQNTTWPVYTAEAGCFEQHIYLDNNIGQPHMDSFASAAWATSQVSSDGSVTYYPCSQGQTWLGYAQVFDAQDLFDYYNGTWYLCNQGPWVPNPYHQFTALTGYNFYYPCGAGLYYFPEAYGYMNAGPQYLVYPQYSLYVP